MNEPFFQGQNTLNRGKEGRGRMNSRKIIGLCILLILLVAYSFGAMLIAIHYLPESRWAELIYYPLAGVFWIFPAMKIVRWMQPPEGQD